MMEVCKQKNNKDENGDKVRGPKAFEYMGSGERKYLKTLQLAPDGKLIGVESRPAKVTKSKVVPVYTDPVRKWKESEMQTDPASRVESSTQTDIMGSSSICEGCLDDSGAVADIEPEAYDLMVREPVPESYWRTIAEERRQALSETLEENEALHRSMEEMKEENGKLSELVEHVDCLVSIINASPVITDALNDVLGDGELTQEVLRAVSSPGQPKRSAESSYRRVMSTPKLGNSPSMTKSKLDVGCDKSAPCPRSVESVEEKQTSNESNGNDSASTS